MKISRCVSLTIATIINAIVCYAAFDDTSSLVMSVDAAGMNGFSVGADYYGSASILSNPANISSKLKVPDISVGYSRIAYGLSDGSNIGRMNFSAATPLLKNLFTLGVGYDNLALESIYSETSYAIGLASTYKDIISIGFSYVMREIKIPLDAYTSIDPLFISRGSGAPSDYVRNFPEYLYGVRLNLGEFSVGYRSGFMDAQNEIYKDRPADIFGIAYTQNKDFKFSADYYCGDKKIYAVGFEKNLFKELLSIRGGFSTGEKGYKRISAGFGLLISNISFDYAIDYPLSGLTGISGTHRIGFKIKLAAPHKELTAATYPAPSSSKPVPPTEVPVNQTQQQKVSISTMSDTVGVASKPDDKIKYSLPISTGGSTYSENTTRAVSSGTVNLNVLPKDVTGYYEVTPILKLEVSTPSVNIPEIEKKIETRQPSMSPAQPVPLVRTHKVEAGETLTSLAEKYYGSPKEWHKIYKANEDKIEKGIIKPGSVLIIP